jgi:hypothetical protein
MTARPSALSWYVPTPDLDDYLSEAQEQQLRTAAASAAWRWQDEHGCDDACCLRCRVGRALAVLRKATDDASAAADVLCGLIPDLREGRDRGAPDPEPDRERYVEASQLLLLAIAALESSGVATAAAMGAPEATPGAPSARLN